MPYFLNEIVFNPSLLWLRSFKQRLTQKLQWLATT